MSIISATHDNVAWAALLLYLSGCPRALHPRLVGKQATIEMNIGDIENHLFFEDLLFPNQPANGFVDFHRCGTLARSQLKSPLLFRCRYMLHIQTFGELWEHQSECTKRILIDGCKIYLTCFSSQRVVPVHKNIGVAVISRIIKRHDLIACASRLSNVDCFPSQSAELYAMPVSATSQNYH